MMSEQGVWRLNNIDQPSFGILCALAANSVQRVSSNSPFKKKMGTHLPPIDLAERALVSPVGVLQAYTFKTPTHTPFHLHKHRIISPSGKASVIGKLCSRSALRTPSLSPNPSAFRRD